MVVVSKSYPLIEAHAIRFAIDRLVKGRRLPTIEHQHQNLNVIANAAVVLLALKSTLLARDDMGEYVK